jgi:glycosyltransferase involved in cell wall biosynthesis
MKVLLVSSRYPWPPWRGNQVRTVQWIEALAEHDITVVCPAPETGEMTDQRIVGWKPPMLARRAWGLAHAALTGLPLQEGLHDCGEARRAVSAALRSEQPDVVIIQMLRCGWAAALVREVAPTARVVFDAIDAMGLHFERSSRAAPPWLAVPLAMEAARSRRREHQLTAAARLTTAVASRDLTALSIEPNRGRVVPVAGRTVSSPSGPASEPVVLLSGNLGYRPTVAGALLFAREVWPGVRARVPDARWVLAGARPARAVRRLARGDGVELHADVPDLSAFLASARVAVAPMSTGSGVPMKVLEAMAAGVPVVANPWAASGLADEAAAAVAVADEPAVWIETLSTLLSDWESAAELGDRGRAAWRDLYHPEVIAEQVRSVIVQAATTA